MTKVMGILNVTPDSFSDGGQYDSVDAAVQRGIEMFAAGADVVDVGGESTRPGAAPVSEDQELERVIPVIEDLSSMGQVSIDTRHVTVASEAVTAGATIINDVSASLSTVAAEAGVSWIAMHMQGLPENMQHDPSYSNVVGEVKDYLVEKALEAQQIGVPQTWIDPGFGFGKTLAHNLALLANIDQFVATGLPVAVGISRKSMLGELLAISDGAAEPVPIEDRLEASLFSAAFTMLKGVDLVRVHDVTSTLRVRALIHRSS